MGGISPTDMQVMITKSVEVAKQYGFKSAEFEEAKNRLIKFYFKLGFRVIKDNIMVYHKTED